MDYTKPTFTVPLSGDKYREGWERIFGKKEPEPPTDADSPEWDRVRFCTACSGELMSDGWCCDCAVKR